jgi:multidrug resistance efflux pump
MTTTAPAKPARPAATSPAAVSRPPRTQRRRLFSTRRMVMLLPVLAVLVIAFLAVTPTTRWAGGTGYIMTDDEVEIRPSVEGAIAQWHARSGDAVDKDQLLIQLHNGVQKAAYEQAVSELAAKRQQLEQLRMTQDLERLQRREQVFQAERNLALARSYLDRMEPGISGTAGGFSVKEIEDSRLRVELASSRLVELQLPKDSVMQSQIHVLTEQTHAAEKAVALREAELLLRQIRSPIAGSVFFNRFEPGEIVKPEHVLGQVFDQGTWVAKLKLSERQIGHVRDGQPVQLSLAAYPSMRFGYITGRVHRIMPIVTPRATGDGVFYVEVMLEAPPPNVVFNPGMTATGFIDTGRTTWLLDLLGW